MRNLQTRQPKADREPIGTKTVIIDGKEVEIKIYAKSVPAIHKKRINQQVELLRLSKIFKEKKDES